MDPRTDQILSRHCGPRCDSAVEREAEIKSWAFIQDPGSEEVGPMIQ